MTEVNKIIQMRNDGYLLKQIAAEIGCSEATVQRHLCRKGMTKLGNLEYLKEKIKQYQSKGYTARKMCQLLHINGGKLLTIKNIIYAENYID